MYKKSFWRGAGFAALYFAVFLVVQFAVSIVGMVICVVNKASTDSTFLEKVTSNDIQTATNALMSAIAGNPTNYMLLIYSVLTTAAVLIFLLITKRNPLKMLEINKLHPVSYVVAIVMGVAMLLFVGCVIDLIPFPQSWIDQLNNTFDPMMSASSVLAILAIGIFGPINEELIFRGGIMNSMRRDSTSVVGIIISSLAFGLMHGIPLQICYATFVGVLIALVFHFTKSIVPCIIIHIVNNTTTTLMNIYADYFPEDFLKKGTPSFGMALGVSGILLALGLCAFYFIERNKRYAKEFSGKAIAEVPQA
ncbi:MAG: CPBP family intramembrane metalloprotease [Oscillospiraceae bacterium]|jgi:membrane protease YdiL (CAAX protease family)|nr:CPBP family intramembrane metalloprotease [Oscillospiraceae bacterium]